MIVPYDPAWPATFVRLRDRLVPAVDGLALSIEHIGSTSVPGLVAKPIIDLVVVVAPRDVRAAIERIVSIGYQHRGTLGVEGREAFAALPGDPAHHLYLSPTDSEELRAQVRFRDRLRNEPDLAARYAALKQQLAAQFRHDRIGYTDAKTDFVVAASRPQWPSSRSVGFGLGRGPRRRGCSRR